jgi:hypothetical protein
LPFTGEQPVAEYKACKKDGQGKRALEREGLVLPFFVSFLGQPRFFTWLPFFVPSYNE